MKFGQHTYFVNWKILWRHDSDFPDFPDFCKIRIFPGYPGDIYLVFQRILEKTFAMCNSKILACLLQNLLPLQEVEIPCP